MFQDSWSTGWADQNMNKIDWEDDEFQDEEFRPNVLYKDPLEGFVSKIDIPDWANMDKDYKPVKAERMGNTDEDFSVVVTYFPNSTLGIGYKRVFMVEKSTQKPFPKMKEMWDELRYRSYAKSSNKVSSSPYANVPYAKGYGIPDNITICDKGELRSAFGVPKTEEIYGIVFELCSIYNDWRKFPNETDYAVIETLKKAKDRIRNMQHHTKEFEMEIDESRRLIKEQQERIAELEKRMNDMYEKGADAMNLLEEHGVKFNLNGEIQDDDEDLTFPGLASVWLNQFITMPYDPSAMITIDSSNSYYTVNTSSNWGILDRKIV